MFNCSINLIKIIIMTEPRLFIMLQRILLKYWRRSVSTSTCRDAPILLHHRSLLEVTGVDGPIFLQGLTTADVLNPTQLVQYSMFLNPQGRVLYDIIVYHVGRGRLWVESDKGATNDIIQHLKRYILRSKVDIHPLPNTTIHALLPSNQEDIDTQGILRITDPRTSQLGDRIISQTPLSSAISTTKEYHIHRMKCGVVEGTGELPPGQCLPFEVNLDYMDGVSFNKGCYLGQELTSRTHHTGVVRKRLVPLTIENRSTSSISWGTPVTLSSGKTVGKILGCYDNHAIGILRLPDLKNGEPLYVDTDSEKIVLNWFKPDWWPQQ